MSGEHRTDAFRAKNPDSTVPYAELPCGTCRSQCTAITEYIDGEYDGKSLIGEVEIPTGLNNLQVWRENVSARPQAGYGERPV